MVDHEQNRQLEDLKSESIKNKRRKKTVDEQIDKLDKKIDSIEQSLEAQIAVLETRIEALENP
jgi:flagellar capping protein FliD